MPQTYYALHLFFVDELTLLQVDRSVYTCFFKTDGKDVVSLIMVRS